MKKTLREAKLRFDDARRWVSPLLDNVSAVHIVNHTPAAGRLLELIAETR
jgi:hypothetical protein